MKVEIIKPDKRLMRLVGGKLPKQLPGNIKKRAEDATTALSEDIRSAIANDIAALWTEVDQQGDMDEAAVDAIYFKAHDMRGTLGTIGEDALGGIADALCCYVEDIRAAGMVPRTNIIWLHVSSLHRAACEEDLSDDLGKYLIDSLCALRHKELSTACPNGCTCSMAHTLTSDFTANDSK